jgi:hypothetical protein
MAEHQLQPLRLEQAVEVEPVALAHLVLLETEERLQLLQLAEQLFIILAAVVAVLMLQRLQVLVVELL